MTATFSEQPTAVLLQMTDQRAPLHALRSGAAAAETQDVGQTMWSAETCQV